MTDAGAAPLPATVDAVVVGGGPAGSTVATLLARAGWQVVCLERERFPRFHVGESLLPANWRIFQRLGVAEQLQDTGRWIRKHGAVFHDAEEGLEQRYQFDNAFGSMPPHAWQVERAPFDHLLLRNAAAAGADVREGWRVERALLEGERVVGVAALGPDGRAHECRAPVVIDASGRDTLLAGQFQLREPYRDMRKGSFFAHLDGVSRAAGDRAGDIHIVRWADGWAWIIPFADGRASVGIVLHARALKQRGARSIPEFFDATLAETPVLRDLVAGAQRRGDVHGVPNISYQTRAQAGPGWVLVGDAAIFLDPVFSTGVLLAMLSAEWVADDLLRAGRGRPMDAHTVRGMRRRLARAHKVFFPWIEGFYDPSFVGRFLRPVNVLGIQSAITTLLAGDVLRRWPVTPLTWIFWWGVSRMRKTREAEGLPVATTVSE